MRLGKKNSSAIILDFSRVPFIDVSAARAVETIARNARHAGKTVSITGMSEKVRTILSGLNADHCFPADTQYETRLEALRAAVGETRDVQSGIKMQARETNSPVPAE